MKAKKLLTLLLAFCLMLSVLAPAAGAIHVAGENVKYVMQGEKNATTGYSWLDKLLVSAGEKLGFQTSLRGQELDPELSLRNGKWVAINADGSVVELKDAQLPQHIQVLRKAAGDFQPADRVVAFVTLEGAATADTYRSILDVPAETTQALDREQDAMLASLEEKLGDVKVVSRFTHLTNSIVIETAFENLEPIAAMKGVKSVFLSPTYEACKTQETVSPMTESSGVMAGVHTVWQELGYTGAGMTIAILDTGLDLDHPSFAADPAAPAWDVQWLQDMLDNNDLRLEELYGKEITAEELYYNAKVPFAFNYATGTLNVLHTDGVGDHGTHVAGIAGANAVEGSGVVGMAPDAQIIVMKVFSPKGGANMYTIIQALQDCMTLGVDVANMSLGSPAGFSVTEIPEIDDIYNRISQSDLIVDVAAGNEGTSSYGSKWGTNMQLTEHIDNATMSSPATYANSLAVGSVDNDLVPADYYALSDGTKIFYMNSVEVLYEYTDLTLLALKEQSPLEYVMIDALGNVEDFYDENGVSIVEGKVAVIKRGTLTFGEKIANAQAAGAIAAIIWNNNDEDDIFAFGMTTSTTDEAGNEVLPTIPTALISLSDGNAMAAAEEKIITIPDDFAYRVNATGGQMSNFSCWGVSPDLRLLPDIAGVGGNIYSCYDNGEYGLMSGTSMATPQIAGLTAVVLQYLREEFPDATADETRMLCDSLLMSTAVTVIDNESKVEASPRQQGAGLANAYNAITAKAYLTVEGSSRPKAELFDSVEGKYSFTFSVHNFSDAEKTYNLRASLLCEDFVDYYGMYYFLAEQDRALDNSAVTFSRETVTVAPGGSEEVTVTIELTAEDKAFINTYFPSGNYVEGFVYLEGEEEVTLSLPFLGFYGQWDAAPLFDQGFWFDDGMWLTDYYVDANQTHHLFYTSLGTGNYDWVPGFNAYTGAQYWYDEEGYPHIYFDPDNMVLSPNGDGALDKITEYYLSLMRNAEEMELIITNENGEVMDYRYFWKESKSMYISNYGSVVPMVYSWTYDDTYDFSDFASGETAYITIRGVIDYEGAEWDTLVENMPIHIDTTAPVLDETKIVESSEEVEVVDETTGEVTTETRNYITLTFTEAHPAAVITMNWSQTQIYDYYNDLEHMVDNGDGTYTVKLDVTGLGDKVTVALCDYGCNESFYNLTYTAADNNPDMDENALYAYQVYHEGMHYYYGYDAMFGWTTIDKATAETVMINSDAYEYYAINAAEYVDGLIFAVDAGNNLLYMAPGVWNRNVICNLGMNIVDLAFNEETGIMYAAVSDEDAGAYGLYTLDLFTGELTKLRNYGDKYKMPWAMTIVDGVMYCTKYYYGGLHTVKLSGNYAINAVTDAEGNEVVIKGSNNRAVTPYYAQSMTYSEADQVIYWAYYDGDSCDLITIDPTTWTNAATAMQYDQEYVGVLMLDTQYTLPQHTEVTKVAMMEEQVILSTGKTHTLVANALPWNAPAENRVLTWTSSDNAIATVDNNGLVTAISGGTVTITASCNGFSASCTVVVVDINGHMNAYKYYDGNDQYGYWLDIDLAGMTEEATFTSPIDFIAAEYNGHTGLIYGYSEVGQCYWFDPATGEYGPLGKPDASRIPADMAYDYSTGTMYVMDYNETQWTSTLYTLNMATGKLSEVAMGADVYVTLACDGNGMLYAISYDGILYELHVMEGELGGGGGVMPLAEGDEVSYILHPNYVMQTPVSTVFYAQSMCYDYNNDVILWLNTDTFSIYWLGGLKEASPYYVNLGEPTGSGAIQYVGAYVIPETIEPLPYEPVESAEAEDVLALVGGMAAPVVNVEPVNATNGKVSQWIVADESIAYINENGMIVGVAAGNTTVTAVILDTDEAGVEHRIEVSFTVTVKNNTDNIYGYLIGDLGNNDGLYWAELDDATTSYAGVNYAFYNGAYLTIYSAEHVDGTIYAYGFDANDWNANFQFLTIDPKTWSVTNAIDLGDGFPFVYDMAYDYTTGTMYAVAGPNDSATDLFYVNMHTGELINCIDLDPMIMSLTVDANGNLYGMAASEEDFDPLTWVTSYGNALMYKLDPVNGTYEVYMDTGVKCNMLASMAYDYDTGYIYWTGLFRGETGQDSGLYLIDMEELKTYNLGAIGSAGAQVTGLMIFAEEYPEQPTNLTNIAITERMIELGEGKTHTLAVFYQPANLTLDLQWSSADETVATVDENGMVTGVSAGTTTVTVTASDGTNTLSAQCQVLVYGAEDYFISYDRTNGGFATISRPDSIPTLYPDVEGSTLVTALEMREGVIYGYDQDNNLFITSVEEGFARTVIGNAGIEVQESYEEHVDGYYTYDYFYEYYFSIRDLAWDTVNNRLLALGCYCLNKYVTCTYPSGYSYSYIDTLEMEGGCRLYEVNLETGALTELTNIYAATGDYYPGVLAMTMTDAGQLYVYSCYMDYISKLDLQTGMCTDISTYQNMGTYGSSDGDYMAMTYDAATDSIYMLFTPNGNRYSLYNFDVRSTAITKVGELSEETMAFGGLVLNDPKYVPTVTVGSATADLGEEVTVDVTISATTLAGYGLKVVYDKEALEITAITKGADAGEGFFSGSKKTGKVTYATTYNEEMEGVLFTITFKVLAEGEHTVSLEIDSFGLDDQTTFEVRTADGVITAEEPHTCVFGEWEVHTPATCTEDGEERRYCECGEYESRTIEATGHTFGEWEVHTPATCTENGEERRYCECGEYESRIIEAHGHNYVDGVCEHCGEEDASNPPTGISALAIALLSGMSAAALVITAKKKEE